ncbi:beta-hexosaminidase 3 isoform X1 [Selaginella moellendorffii]|uniref:beta-hexosaminidase 3 isoform X1 n=1 Tax=Selaginella moellendorffii TaxID=88036 RepID=UPI000D1CB326|nr:beta-hexosaminidase 3 isoform X1 [Selaginella moellendorffii]|eukprot:XP_024543655.1 beta-hexosaminidase 3 isoform X1 [Selaginella moellendorffii]
MTLSPKFSIYTSAPQDLVVLHAGMDRYTALISGQRTLVQDLVINPPKFVLDKLRIDLFSYNQSLHIGTDESYHLQIPDPLDPKSAFLQANTVYGALRGLETFSQICRYNVEAKTIFLENCPWDIFDEPRFLYRGLLIDTARHYLPLNTIKTIIDSMAYAKLNVLHWHISDDESFPLEIPSFPKLWNGSYSNKQRYSLDHAKDLVKYAELRGISIMAEIDVPGHARSWGVGYPQLWPSQNCRTPLDVSKEFTFEVIDGIFFDLRKAFPFELLHIGGDEVNTNCWESTKLVSEWLGKHNLTATQAYKFFVLEVQKLAMKHGYVPVSWQEAFQNFGSSLPKNTIIQNWLGSAIAPSVVKSGLKCIISEQASWYLDHFEVTWEQFYNKEPYDSITDGREQQLILGGEVCMWGEKVDGSNIHQIIWPRAAAAAEKFWSPFSVTNLGPHKAGDRMETFRRLLNERGI